jgi:hypothetical protein
MWKLTINKKKSKVLVFGTLTQRRTYLTSNWVFENNTLEQVEEYSYLGIKLHYSGNFKQTQNILYNKVWAAVTTKNMGGRYHQKYYTCEMNGHKQK